MPRQLALFICLLFILWLFVKDRKQRPMTSGALWIPLLWIMIIGSRPVSYWFGAEIQVETPDGYLEGSPLDRNVFLLLIITGLLVLFRRRINWGKFFASNRWLFAFFLYCGISILWSPYPFVGFKRWAKDLGNVVMILIILTETDPAKALKAVFARFTYFAIPLSTVLIKYFEEIGRYYNQWTWEPSYCGITTNKNELGGVLIICGLFLIWDLIEMRTACIIKTKKTDMLGRIVLMLMLAWLLKEVESSTALVCLLLGTGILLFMRLLLAKRHVRHLGTYSLALSLLIFLLYSAPGISEAFFGMVGRDSTLTGRTDLWADLLKEPINPLIGTGYKSFWLGPFAEHMWEKYSFHPVQAHNGYLETYLNLGLVGVCLLMAIIISTGIKLKKELLLGSSYGMLRFSFLVVAVFYNWTEAMFNALNLVWIILLIAAFSYQLPPRFVHEISAKIMKSKL